MSIIGQVFVAMAALMVFGYLVEWACDTAWSLWTAYKALEADHKASQERKAREAAE